MGKKSNIDFLLLLDDKEFVQLVRNANNKDEFLRDLEKKYPVNSPAVRYAIEFIQINQGDKRNLGSEDFDKVLNNILDYSGSKKRKDKRRLITNYFGKAAVIFIILSFGLLIGYQWISKDPLEKLVQSEIEGEDKGIIILSDGSKHLLNGNDSYIEYNTGQKEVIVKNIGNENERFKNSGNKSELNQIVVPYGQTHTVALSDGSVVQLNAGSKLVFPAEFNGNTREVYLKGEGFFEVSENKNKPFKVRTEHLDVEVLGTKFNVSAYNSDELVSTVLVEGKVKVSQKNRIFSNDEFIINPGQGCFYTVRKKESVVQDVDLATYTSWKDGWFTFKEMSLADIVGRLKKYYNKTIEIDGEILANTLVSGKLALSDNFMEVLQSLSITIEGTYQQKSDRVYIIKN